MSWSAWWPILGVRFWCPILLSWCPILEIRWPILEIRWPILSSRFGYPGDRSWWPIRMPPAKSFELRKGLDVNIASAMASEPSDRTKILNSIRLPRAGTVFLEQEARDTHESSLIRWLIFGVLFLLISSHPVLSQPWPKGIMCPKCLQFRSVFVGCETFSKLSRWGYDAVGRALAGHFALANWLLGILRELIYWYLLYASNQTSFCGEYDFAVLPPKRLGSSPNAAAEVFFHRERSGHLEVGWSQPK